MRFAPSANALLIMKPKHKVSCSKLRHHQTWLSCAFKEDVQKLLDFRGRFDSGYGETSTSGIPGMKRGSWNGAQVYRHDEGKPKDLEWTCFFRILRKYAHHGGKVVRLSGSALHTRYSWGTGLSISTVKSPTEIQQLLTIFFQQSFCHSSSSSERASISSFISWSLEMALLHNCAFSERNHDSKCCKNRWTSNSLDCGNENHFVIICRKSAFHSVSILCSFCSLGSSL